MLVAASFFQMQGQPISCEPYGSGHINQTYLVITDQQAWYILQKINNQIFQDVDGLMRNIGAVTRHLAKTQQDPRRVLTIVPSLEGRDYHRDAQGGYWRCYVFVRDSLCLQRPESEADFEASGLAFGTFQSQLADFEAASLSITIQDFHNTPDRYRKLHAAIKKDSQGRVQEVQEELRFVLEREERAGLLQRLQAEGKLPLRVTHNDTKLNNVLLDKTSREPLCVIDLDTVMPGLASHDFGDSIRFGASTADEDEVDLSKVTLSLPMFRAYTKGFLQGCGKSLTREELLTLPEGAFAMTLECGVRFLTDYLEGDSYFRIHRPQHNLDRCRTQFKLVAQMEEKWAEMEGIIQGLLG